MNPAGSRQEFARLIRLSPARLDLARAALLVAAEEYPLLDPAPTSTVSTSGPSAWWKPWAAAGATLWPPSPP